MRTGVICSGAVAVAAIATAVLIQIDALGGAKFETTTAAQTEAAPTIRRVDAPPPASPAPAAQPQTIAASDPVNAQSGGDSAPTRLVATTAETTGSVAPSTSKLYVNGSRVALRSAPDGSAKIVDRMSDGQKLVEMSRNGEWVRVRFADSNAEGWVNSSLVSPTRRK